MPQHINDGLRLLRLAREHDLHIPTRQEMRDAPKIAIVATTLWIVSACLWAAAVMGWPGWGREYQWPLAAIASLLAGSVTLGASGLLAGRGFVTKTLVYARRGYLTFITLNLVVITGLGVAAPLTEGTTNAKMRLGLTAALFVFALGIVSVTVLVPLVSSGRWILDEPLTHVLQLCVCLWFAIGATITAAARVGADAVMPTLALTVPLVILALRSTGDKTRLLRREITDRLIDLELICHDTDSSDPDIGRALARVITLIHGDVPTLLRPVPIADSGIRLMLRYAEMRFRPETWRSGSSQWFEDRLDHLDISELRPLIASFAIELRTLAENRRPTPSLP